MRSERLQACIVQSHHPTHQNSTMSQPGRFLRVLVILAAINQLNLV